MSRECHPVWKELHAGRLYQGQPVEEVIVKTHPIRVERHAEFVCLDYQKGQQGLCLTGVTIFAKDGRLLSGQAWSCTWTWTFFDGMTNNDYEVYRKAYEDHWRPRRELREKE